jgi:uncharacterized protein
MFWGYAVPLAIACAAALSLATCGGDSAATSDRHAMLVQIVDDTVLPTYRQLVEASNELAVAASALRARPDAATLAGSRAAWRRARAAWRRSKAFEFGPAESLRTFAKIDWSPIRAERIEQEISGDAELTAEHVAGLGANVKGLLAIEYLLFDPNGDDAEVLAAFDGDIRRLDYLVALTGDLHAQAGELLAAWEPGEGDYARTLTATGNEEYPTLKSAVDEVVNRLIFAARDVEAKLGVLAADEGEPDPTVLEARLSGNEVEDLLDDLRGAGNVYRGATVPADGRGMAGVVMTTAPAIDESISLSFELALAAVNDLPRPLAPVLETEQERIGTAQLGARRLVRSLEIDLVSALGATLAFNPGDGD